ncbi:MAG: hypothetical protein M3Y87_16595 [Myxococcota bacterium]|nr:hypothetical protein [Myxococcota bacterium]
MCTPRLLALSALALLVTALPSRAAAQNAEDRHLRLGAHLALGMGGDADVFTDTEIGSGRGSESLDVSAGFGARAEVPILDFVSVGGLFEAFTSETNASGAEREWAFDFDAFVRLRYVLELVAGELFLEPYVLLPLGFTFAMLDDPDGDGDEAWPGWNTGVLAGVSVFSSARIGGFLELGWRHHEVYTGVSNVPVVGDTQISLVTNQFALNLGVMFLLE